MSQLQLIDQPQSERILLLELSQWATDFSAMQLEVLSSYFQSYSAPAGFAILKEGEKNNFFSLLCAGMVEVIKEASDGERKKVANLGVGKVLGEISFFDGGTCSASIVAKEQVTLLVLDKAAFNKLSEESPSVALIIVLNLVKGLSGRLREATGRLVDYL